MALGACAPADRPVPTTSARPAVPTPTAPAPGRPADRDAILVVQEVRPGNTLPDVSVVAVAPDGRRRTLAAWPSVGQQLGAGWQPLTNGGPSLGPTGLLTYRFRQPDVDHSEVAFLVFDVGNPQRPPLVRRAASDTEVLWAPDGRLALAIPGAPMEVIDPVAGTTTSVRVPTGVEPPGVWAADGSGLLTTRTRDQGGQRGVLGLDGAFTVDAAARPFTPLRPFISNDAGEEVFVNIVEATPPKGEFRVETSIGHPTGQNRLWYAQATTPGGLAVDPANASWDRRGTGLWLALPVEKTWRIMYLPGPGQAPRTVALVPLRGSKEVDLEAIAPDEAFAVLRFEPPPGTLVLVDLRTGNSLDLGPTGGGVVGTTFVGWQAAAAP